MVADRVVNVVLVVVLIVALAIIGGASIHIWQLKHQVGEANKTIATLDKNTAVLDTAVRIQNDAIDSLADETDRAIDKSEQALAELKPLVEEEERRILGIRSAQHSSVSSDSGVRLENIRQKMLKDALL